MSKSYDEKIDILLVDDRPENLLALEATLDSPNYNIIKANSGAEALRYLLNNTCALILMDVQMPGMDGFETAAIIKKNDRSSEIPIIFVTAISKEEGFVHRGYKTGAVDYIFKPLDGEILRSKVSVFVELYKSKKKIEQQAAVLREIDQRDRQRVLAMLELKSLKREQILQKNYKNIVEGLKNGIIWLYDPIIQNFTFVSPSASTILDIPIEAWNNGRDFWSRQVHPEDRDEVLQSLTNVLKTGGSIEIKHRFLNKNANIKWFKTGIHLVEDLETDTKLLHGLSMDITEIKNAEMELEKSLQMRDEFLSIASHELKTPLTSLKLQLQLALKNVIQNQLEATKEKSVRMLTGSVRQADRLTSLIDDLLDVSKIQSGKLTFEFEEVNLTELVKELVERFSEEFSNAHCHVEVDLATQEIIGYWNQSRIEQVLVNLLSNSIKYAPDGKIRIGLKQQGDIAEFYIHDSGPGIPQEKQEQIFNRFERITHSKNINGLGLGLYIVRQIILAHEGKVFVESKPGQGSKFVVQLPLKKLQYAHGSAASH